MNRIRSLALAGLLAVGCGDRVVNNLEQEITLSHTDWTIGQQLDENIFQVSFYGMV